MIPKINDENVLKEAFEGINFGPAKFSAAAPTKHQIMARVHLNKHHVCDSAPASKENKQCTSQHMPINIVATFCCLSLGDGKIRNLA